MTSTTTVPGRVARRWPEGRRARRGCGPRCSRTGRRWRPSGRRRGRSGSGSSTPRLPALTVRTQSISQRWRQSSRSASGVAPDEQVDLGLARRGGSGATPRRPCRRPRPAPCRRRRATRRRGARRHRPWRSATGWCRRSGPTPVPRGGWHRGCGGAAPRARPRGGDGASQASPARWRPTRGRGSGRWGCRPRARRHRWPARSRTGRRWATRPPPGARRARRSSTKASSWARISRVR